MGGTGFFHRSGNIITAAHVVAGCPVSEILIITSSGKQLSVSNVKTDFHLDLALVTTPQKGESIALPIAHDLQIAVGSPIVTWGFPAGYNGYLPLLTYGYLSGVDRVPASGGSPVARWVVNAAFNGGNSGGPVINNETGEVVGVVDSKLAPIPPTIESALNALSTANSGLMYNVQTPDGKTTTLSEGQVVGSVLTYLRSQTQLVLGQAVTSNDLLNFLKSAGAE